MARTMSSVNSMLTIETVIIAMAGWRKYNFDAMANIMLAGLYLADHCEAMSQWCLEYLFDCYTSLVGERHRL